MMRPVFISHMGLWCAAGSTAAGVRQALSRRQVPAGRLDILDRDFPYAFATRPQLPWRARLEEALAAVGATLDLQTLPPEARLLMGSSSLRVGAVEGEGWPPRQDTTPLDASVRAVWGLGHKGWTFSSGCTSGVHALDAAVGLIEGGTVDEALVLGVEILNRTTPAGFASLQLLSPTEARPLDPERSGLVLGEAVAAVRLTSRSGPWRLHAPALALDTTSVTGHAQDGSTIACVMEEALAHAGHAPGEIRAIKLQAAGATGTDAVEARALHGLFGAEPPPVFSIKASLGHTLGACGIAELVAVLQCGEEGWLPPTGGFRGPDPELGLEPIVAPLAWGSGPVLFNIQGFGGSLASWVVERA